ncbi:MAG TPA: hypothetical protein VHS78_11685 [Candidatus Elarobacter sp.]|jgi:hypothetical protein|nr:hypothetical protein [Candidatus Elarobacter sp.]
MKAFIACVFLISTLTISLPLVAEANPQIAAGDHHQSSKKSDGARQQSRLPTPDQQDRQNLDCASANNSKNAECQNLAANQRISDANAAVAKYTLVLIIVGIVQALALIFTLVATFRAANAAAESVRLSERAMKLTERAYIEVDEIHPPAKLNIPQIPRIVVWMTNRGRTPATLIGGVFKFRIFDEADEVPEPVYDEDELAAHVLLGPGSRSSHDVTTEQVVTEELMGGVYAGTKHFIVWGRITYLDVFGERHETRFGTSMHFVGHDRNTGNYTISFKSMRAPYNYAT